MKVLNLRSAVLGIAAAGVCFGISARAQAQVGNPNLIPAKSAYIVSVPDSKALWSAWKGNAIYASYKKVMESPEIAEKFGSFSKELQTIETALGYKLDGETLSSIFKNADIYIGPGENAGSSRAGAVMGIADKDKLNKLLDLAEKAAAQALADAATASDAEAKSETDSKKDGETKSEGEEKATPAPRGAKKPAAKPADAEKDGQGGADDSETTKGEAGSSPISSETYSGFTVKRFATGEDNEVYYSIAGDLLLVSNDRGEIKALIDRSAKKDSPDTLQAAESYKKISAALAERKGEVYVVGSQKEALEMQQGGGMDALRELTQKLSPVDSYGSSVKIEAKQISQYSYGILSSNSADSLLGKHPGDKPLEAIKYIPGETLLAFATSLMDSDMIYKLVTDAAAAAGSKELDDQLQAAEGMLGFSVKNDFIPALGNEFALGVNSVTIGNTGPSVDAAIIFSVRDKAKMQKVLDGLQKLAAQTLASPGGSGSEPETTPQGGAEDETKPAAKKDAAAKTSGAGSSGGFKQAKVGETTINYADSPTLMGFTPGYALDGDYLVLGSTKDAIKNAVEVKAGSKSLSESEAMKALGPRVTTTGNMFQYFNFASIWKTTDLLAKSMLNPTLAQGYEAIKVLKTAAGVSAVKDGALISEGILLLN